MFEFGDVSIIQSGPFLSTSEGAEGRASQGVEEGRAFPRPAQSQCLIPPHPKFSHPALPGPPAAPRISPYPPEPGM